MERESGRISAAVVELARKFFKTVIMPVGA